MLVVTRKVNQAIAVGDDVLVVVLSVERDKVKLGIVAPNDRAIRRVDHPSGSPQPE